MSLYLLLKDAHNIVRWLVILAGLWAILRAWSGLFGKKGWTRGDRVSGLVFSSTLNLQFVLGAILYFASPITQAALANFRGAMKDSTLRFFLVEHPFAMILAAVIAQVGYSLSKRAPSDAASFRRAAISYTIAGVLILAAIPWPFLPYGRPLLPGLSAP